VDCLFNAKPQFLRQRVPSLLLRAGREGRSPMGCSARGASSFARPRPRRTGRRGRSRRGRSLPSELPPEPGRRRDAIPLRLLGSRARRRPPGAATTARGATLPQCYPVSDKRRWVSAARGRTYRCGLSWLGSRAPALNNPKALAKLSKRPPASGSQNDRTGPHGTVRRSCTSANSESSRPSSRKPLGVA
jgi:hypothetical protein